MTQPPSRQIRLEIPANLNAIYSNAVMISQTNNEIVLDFLQMMPPDQRPRVQTRIVMTPTNAKLFLNALQTNLARYEEKHGEIIVPQQTSSLADQLFGGIKPSEEGEPTDE
jgi:hypothetical protein